MDSYPSGSQSSKKRKVVDLTHDDEEDEEAAARAQAAMAGMNLLIIYTGYIGVTWEQPLHPNVPPIGELSQLTTSGINTSKPKRAGKKKGEEPDEKRLKRFRPKPPHSYLERLGRVKTQRMFLVDRNRTTSEDGTHEEEVFDLAGSTGNIYQITISKVPKCTCPDAGKGNQCKHTVYVCLHYPNDAVNLQ
jgi:hypothetical protein